MIILPAADFDTARNFFAGVPTKSLASARWIKWSLTKVDRFSFCNPRMKKRRDVGVCFAWLARPRVRFSLFPTTQEIQDRDFNQAKPCIPRSFARANESGD